MYEFVYLISYVFVHTISFTLQLRWLLAGRQGRTWTLFLVIGEFHFTKRMIEGFTATNECWDVFAAMELSGKLLLEEHSVHDSYSQISDSMMKLIKMISSPGPDDGPINNNSFGRVNKKFIRFFIDMLSLQLAFDNWYVSIHILEITRYFAQFKFLIESSFSGTLLRHRWCLCLLRSQLPLRLPMLFSITNRFWFH